MTTDAALLDGQLCRCDQTCYMLLNQGSLSQQVSSQHDLHCFFVLFSYLVLCKMYDLELYKCALRLQIIFGTGSVGAPTSREALRAS